MGSIENTHKSLGNFLRIQTETKPVAWSQWLPFWVFSYNTSVHTATGYSPYELVFGKVCHLPSNLVRSVEPIYNFEDYVKELKYRIQEAHKDAREYLLKYKNKMKSKYDRNIYPLNFKVGDKVLVRNYARINKLEPYYLGPYEIVNIDRPNLIIKIRNKNKTVHMNNTKLFYSNK